MRVGAFRVLKGPAEESQASSMETTEGGKSEEQSPELSVEAAPLAASGTEASVGGQCFLLRKRPEPWESPGWCLPPLPSVPR